MDEPIEDPMPRPVTRRWEKAEIGNYVTAVMRERIVSVGPSWRPFRYWSPVDWFYLARYKRWARRNF